MPKLYTPLLSWFDTVESLASLTDETAEVFSCAKDSDRYLLKRYVIRRSSEDADLHRAEREQAVFTHLAEKGFVPPVELSAMGKVPFLLFKVDKWYRLIPEWTSPKLVKNQMKFLQSIWTFESDEFKRFPFAWYANHMSKKINQLVEAQRLTPEHGQLLDDVYRSSVPLLVKSDRQVVTVGSLGLHRWIKGEYPWIFSMDDIGLAPIEKDIASLEVGMFSLGLAGIAREQLDTFGTVCDKEILRACGTMAIVEALDQTAGTAYGYMIQKSVEGLLVWFEILR